jgi:Cu+-exporting ATPase
VSEIETIRFPVAGMTCPSCVNRISRSLRKVDGVSRVKVDLRHETATVSRTAGSAPDAALSAAVERAGYTANLTAKVSIPAEATRGWLAGLFFR